MAVNAEDRLHTQGHETGNDAVTPALKEDVSRTVDNLAPGSVGDDEDTQVTPNLAAKVESLVAKKGHEPGNDAGIPSLDMTVEDQPKLAGSVGDDEDTQAAIRTTVEAEDTLVKQGQKPGKDAVTPAPNGNMHRTVDNLAACSVGDDEDMHVTPNIAAKVEGLVAKNRHEPGNDAGTPTPDIPVEDQPKLAGTAAAQGSEESDKELTPLQKEMARRWRKRAEKGEGVAGSNARKVAEEPVKASKKDIPPALPQV